MMYQTTLTDKPNTGFSNDGAITWLPLNMNYAILNVKAQMGNPSTHLEVFRALVRLR